MKYFAALLVLFIATTNEFCSATETFSYPGGVAQLIVTKQSDDIPDVKFGLNEPAIIEYPNHWRILVGLSLETLPGEYVTYIKPAIEGVSGYYEKVVVKQHIYPFSEHLELETKLAKRAVYKTHKSFSDIDFSNTQQPSLPLQWPLNGIWSDNFGHKLYDAKREALHTPNAIVISATKLSTVVAPQTAIVSKIEISESGLATVFLDHGRGLYSILSGLSDLTVELGNGIVAGAVIGKLSVEDDPSNDGSSTSPRTLVWQTVINNTYVDPRVLTKLKP